MKKHNYLKNFINQFEEGGEYQELSNDDWTVSSFLKWLEINNFEIVKSNKKVDWVFWFTIEKRKGWFKKFWKTRGSNFMEIQIYDYKISIGMPWHPEVVKKAGTSYPLEGINHFHEANKQNRMGIQKWGRFRFIKN